MRTERRPTFPLLAGLPEADRSRLLDIARPRSFDRGDVVFHAGAEADGLHLVASGRFAVRSDAPTGDTAMLRLLGPGAFFGELALLDPDSRRSATVRAMEAAETLVIARSEFRRLRNDHPSLDRFLVEALGARVRELTALLVDALFTPVDKRVLARLLEAAEMWGGAVVPLTQQDVAELAGTTRPTVNRVLRQVEGDGLIELARGRIRLVDRAELARRAEA